MGEGVGVGIMVKKDLTLIPYPGAIFIRTISFSSLRVGISARKIWKIWLLLFLYLDCFSAKKTF